MSAVLCVVSVNTQCALCARVSFSIRTALIKVMLFDCGLIICVHSIYDVTLEHIHVIMPRTRGVLVSVFLLLVVLYVRFPFIPPHCAYGVTLTIQYIVWRSEHVCVLVMCVLSLVFKCVYMYVHILFDSERGAGKKDC